MKSPSNEMTIEEVFDYLVCPLKHHMKHERGMEETDANAVQGIAYKDALHQTLYYYYASLQQGRVPTLKQMYEKFAKLWHEKSDIPMEGVFVEDLAQSTRLARIRKEKYLHQGYELIRKFYKENEKVEQFVIGVNHEYRIAIGDVVIKGHFELIRERVDKKRQSRFIEVVDFRTSLKKPEGFFLRNDLHATFMHYAFAATFKSKPDAFVLDYLGAGEAIEFTRNERDYKRMLATLSAVAGGIEREEKFPRQGFHCKQCPFRDECERWEF